MKLWATRATDGTVHVVLINDNFSKPATVNVPLSSPAGPGTLEALRAPHIGATSGVTIGGRTFGAATTTGLLPPYQLQQVTASGGRYAVRVPPATAIMLTVPGSASSSTTTSTSSVDDDGALTARSVSAAGPLDGRRRARETGHGHAQPR